MKLRLALTPALLFVLPLQAWQQSLTLDQVLKRVQENVVQFEASLPDFVCTESITSSKLSGGIVSKQTVIESTFVGIQKKDKDGRIHYNETRELASVDGKKAGKGQKLKGPFLLRGGFSGLLSTTFDALMAPHRNYRLESAQSLEGKEVLVVGFSTKKGQTGIGANFNGKGFLVDDSGKAWIDPDSMQVLRLERLVLNGPRPFPLWSTWVDYGQVLIGGRLFWMPKFVRSEVRSGNSGQPEGRFTAEYTNYRKFEVSSGIVSEK
ncbi:MAG TPA: hypothetical protein VEU96_21670 [Bryobacteraceae bacterium]|nr:hypothetical protein [Bryobacteraceae bacterium]